jgi:glycosyltransferase involved in cell wall biosynthesis
MQGLSLARPPERRRRDQIDLMLCEYSARARAHGMVDYLDPSTFITWPRDILGDFGSGSGISAVDIVGLDGSTRALALAPLQLSEYNAGLSDVFQAARAAALGLRVIIDGTCLDASEMGHQVTLLALIEALAEHPDIEYVGVAVPGPLPRYAAERLTASNVDVRAAPDGDFTVFPQADIVHRPFQPGHGMRPESWTKVGYRTLMTIHDLIAYQVPGYHDSPEAWFIYRNIVRNACGEIDALIVISEDVRRAVAGERLSVDPERIHVIPNGTTHLRGDEPEVMPGELLHRGFTGEDFLLVLGTNYSHKNRDLAVRTLDELTARGHSLALVMAGAYVPCGSSRAAEAASWQPALKVYRIPDVSSAERNWLLRHASVVLYPTSAEGFGLIPEEAAAFGTPTLFVPFGPLGERHAGLPVTPRGWSAGAFADAAERLLGDPALSAAQVAAITEGGADYGWGAAANLTVEAYWAVLGRPARSGKAQETLEEEEP